MPAPDHFSPIAANYARGRIGYPRDLFQFLADQCPEHQLAWDCATGTGQAAGDLVDSFSQVVATDISPELLALTRPHPRVAYRKAPAEASGLEASSVDVIVVAQAVHWFNLGEFWREVQRVSKPNGLLAYWGYNWSMVSPEVDRVLEEFKTTIAAYWPKQSALLHQGYRSVHPPFAEIECPRFEARAEWALADYLAHLRSWSAVRYYREAVGSDPVLKYAEAFAVAWPESPPPARWPLITKVFRPGATPT